MGEAQLKTKTVMPFYFSVSVFFRRPVISIRAVSSETGSDIGCGLCDSVTPIKI